MDKEGLDKLLGVVSHDLKKPLNNLKMFSKILPKKLDDQAFIDKFIGDLEKDSESVLLFLTNLRSYLLENEDISDDLDQLIRNLKGD